MNMWRGLSSPQSWRAGKPALTILAFYAFLSLITTYPLILNFTTHAPGDISDAPALTWNLWWIKFSIFNANTNPLFTNYVFYPVGVDLVAYTLTLWNGFIALPIIFISNYVAANNFIVLFELTLSAYGMYLLAYDRLTVGSRDSRAVVAQPRWAITLAAIFAGFIFGLGSFHLNYVVQGQPDFVGAQWIPFYFFYLIRAFDDAASRGDIKIRERSSLPRDDAAQSRPVRNGALCGLFFAMTAWTELTYAAFLGLLTVVYLLLLAISAAYKIYHQDTKHALSEAEGTPRKNFAFVPHLHRTARSAVQVFVTWCFGGKSLRIFFSFTLALGIVAALGIAPMLFDIVKETLRYGDYWTVGAARTQIFSADLFGFLLPSSYNPVLGFLTRDLPYQTFKWTFAGIVPLALAAYAGARLRPARTWVWLAMIFGVLMMGPVLQIAGSLTSIPLPFNLLNYIPILKSNRYPMRLNALLMLTLALAAAYALAYILSRPRWKAATLGILAFAFVEQLVVPLPLTDLRVPEIFNTIRADPGDFAVLDLPLGWRDSAGIQGAIDYRAHFWQSAHQKRLLDGNTSRNPSFKFQYFLEAPIINSIVAVENGRDLDDTRRAQDRAMAREVLRFYDIRYLNAFRAKTDPKVLDYVLDLFPATEIYRDGERTVYRVPPQTRERGAIDQLSETASLYFDDDWGRAQTLAPNASAGVAPEGFGYRWAERDESRLWLPLSQGEYEIKFKLRAPNTSQKISVRVNEVLIKELTVTNEWDDYEVRIPYSAARNGLNELLFTTYLSPISTMRQDNYNIGDTGIVSPVDISVTASGFDAGRLGEIFVAGKNVITSFDSAALRSGRRGYTLVALNAQTGAVERSDRFDTFADPNESRRLAQFVAALPPGTIVAGAAVDDVSKELQQVAIDALRELGVESDLRFQFRAAHAFIGVKGAQPGQAVESVDARLPANVSVGKNVNTDRVAFALGTVTWEIIR